MKTSSRSDQHVIAIVLVAFLLYYLAPYALDPFNTPLRTLVPNRVVFHILVYLVISIPLMAGVWLIHRQANVARGFGLMANPLTGLVFAIACTLPSFLGYDWLSGGLAGGLTFTTLMNHNILAGFFEETIFRGFLFGQLFSQTRLGFVPSIIFCSLIFASGHLYQSHDPVVLAGVLATTFAGSVLFAWLYVEWGWNIWVPVCLHALMDVAWYIFAAGHNAAGGWEANVFRGITVALAIVITIVHKRRSGKGFLINRSNLWWMRSSATSPSSMSPA